MHKLSTHVDYFPKLVRLSNLRMAIIKLVERGDIFFHFCKMDSDLDVRGLDWDGRGLDSDGRGLDLDGRGPV